MTNILTLTNNRALDILHDTKPVTLAPPIAPFQPVIATSAAQQAVGTLNGFAVDFLMILKEAGCDPSEGFAVCSILESMIRDHSKIVDVSADECDMVWNEDRFA